MTTQIIDRQNTAATQTVNPFSGAAATASAIPQADNPLAASDAARAVAEVQAALLVARMNPRDPVRAMDRILNACTRPTLAESSTYAFSRGGTSVTGPTRNTPAEAGKTRIDDIERKISAWLGYNSPTRGQASLIKGLRAASGES
jgi:hypothetical protein